ncbi:MAG TPA: Clp protease N-terminal domain-containing protein [Candidatus Polarisedimenticolia bacterium]|nr:Clp protease N-terminal domain-containing protein [Candidatus Polarisedimenticolia bacterium]
MFERYSERARRVIFFARYEASQYGSPYIETEHLLLGLLREDSGLRRLFLGPSSVAADIRTEIERQITQRERISTSVEMPLTEECMKVLKLAAEESERLAQRDIGTEHILVALLRVEGSLAARLLRVRGLKPDAIREQLAKAPGSVSPKASLEPNRGAIATLDSFLAGLKWYNWEQLALFFAQNVHFVDSKGKCWRGRDEIEKQFEVLFAPYAKKNVTFMLEGTYLGPAESAVANVLWENVTLGDEATRSMHRMTVIVAQEREEWVILLLQVTPVIGN